MRFCASLKRPTGERVLEDLVEKAQRGDAGAFAILAEQWAPRAMAVARMILRDDEVAADATQESLVRIWTHVRQVRHPERFDAWVYAIVVNECRRELRRSRRQQHLVRQLDMPRSVAPGVSAEARDEMGAAFRRLRPEHREVLVLRYYVELEPREIAEIVRARPGTVRSRLHHGLRALRAELDAERRAADGDGRAPMRGAGGHDAGS